LPLVAGAVPAQPGLHFGADRRIATRAEYERLLRGGTRKSMFGFTFIVSPRPAGPARLGILMSLKVARRANVRNRVKRCIREAFRTERFSVAAIDVLVRPPQNIRVQRDLVARLRSAFAALSR
jgi:ribonuclease P protein component